MGERRRNSAGKACDKAAYHIGEVLPDGWIYLGISPATGQPYSLEPAESAPPDVVSWYDGGAHVRALRENGFATARLPFEEKSDRNALKGNELLDIFQKMVWGGHNYKARLHTNDSDDNGLDPTIKYWSASTSPGFPDSARMRLFDVRYLGGHRCAYSKSKAVGRVRCVRDEPGLKLP